MSITANLKKTYYYLKKNGITDTCYAVCERLYARRAEEYLPQYQYAPVKEDVLEEQRKREFHPSYKFSILVPMYETKPEYAKAMIASVLAQTYSNWELILADASASDLVKQLVEQGGYTRDPRIRYVPITENGGISENTNAALSYAQGDYTALLDHDDLLTPDALYEMAAAIEDAKQQKQKVALVYSDEDKCDSTAQIFYEPHRKPDFNLDMLFSNNYICHFLVMKTELMKQLGFRKEYDGAQDFDLVLRAVLGKKETEAILHVRKVLYHWRCHEQSTAENPQSKRYAYEAGKRAVEAAMQQYMTILHGKKALQQTVLQPKAEKVQPKEEGFWVNEVFIRITHTRHNGYYRVEYGSGSAEEIFSVRTDIAAVGGPVINKNKITSGILDLQGNSPWKGMPKRFSGYMHRMAIQQNCAALDLANAVLRPGCSSVEMTDEKDVNIIKLKYNITNGVFGSDADLFLYDPLYQKTSEYGKCSNRRNGKEIEGGNRWRKI